MQNAEVVMPQQSTFSKKYLLFIGIAVIIAIFILILLNYQSSKPISPSEVIQEENCPEKDLCLALAKSDPSYCINNAGCSSYNLCKGATGCIEYFNAQMVKEKPDSVDCNSFSTDYGKIGCHGLKDPSFCQSITNQVYKQICTTVTSGNCEECESYTSNSPGLNQAQPICLDQCVFLKAKKLNNIILCNQLTSAEGSVFCKAFVSHDESNCNGICGLVKR